MRFPEIAEELRTWCDGNLALGEGSEGYHCHEGVIRGQYMGSGHLITSLRWRTHCGVEYFHLQHHGEAWGFRKNCMVNLIFLLVEPSVWQKIGAGGKGIRWKRKRGGEGVCVPLPPSPFPAAPKNARVGIGRGKACFWLFMSIGSNLPPKYLQIVGLFWACYFLLILTKDLFIKNRTTLSNVLLLCLVRFFMNKALLKRVLKVS